MTASRSARLVACLCAALLLAGVWLVAQEKYPLGPDSPRQSGVPQGKVTKHTSTSQIFPGTVRDYWIYAPAQGPKRLLWFAGMSLLAAALAVRAFMTGS